MKRDLDCNITVYDAQADEYYPVFAFARNKMSNVLDKNHFFIAIKSEED